VKLIETSINFQIHCILIHEGLVNAMKPFPAPLSTVLFLLLSFGDSSFCCLCPEETWINGSEFCGQELRGPDCILNSIYECVVGARDAKPPGRWANCNNRLPGERHCAMSSLKECRDTVDHPGFIEKCLKGRGCYSPGSATQRWKDFTSVPPKLRFKQ
jgi:hypothetical protein